MNPPKGYELFTPIPGQPTEGCLTYRLNYKGLWEWPHDAVWSDKVDQTGKELLYARPIAYPATPESVLQEAERLIHGDRQQSYGDAYESFNRIAKLWSAYKGVQITPKDVACMMILMKVSRSVTSSKRDNWTDMAGYAALGADIEAHEEAPE